MSSFLPVTVPPPARNERYERKSPRPFYTQRYRADAYDVSTFEAVRVKHGKVTVVRTAVEAAEARLMFSPPYSPAFEPIDNAFAELKRS